MPLTPADIHNTEFGKATFGRRGYDEDHVDTLLDEVTGEMIRLLEENSALQNQLAAAGSDRQDRAAAAQLSALTVDLDRARRACERAEQHARLTRHQLDEARRSAATSDTARGDASVQPVLRMAQRTADGYLHEAQEKSGRLLAEARERTDRTLHEAQDTVDAIGRKSQRLQETAAAELAAGRASMTRDIDSLSRFIDDYRAGMTHDIFRRGRFNEGTAGS
ncbi:MULTISPECIES: DivIVA domain-containing protein [Actinoplanes]|uniref:DivIVA domain-containing protein n=1 Tax=Actinoplanes TaxID=1865 RepID=UPI0006988D7B|nr:MULTISPECIES: DivIVA domain-containing protein [Actinoplanes]GLY05064.1 hypothetical protein Acsp01_54430 [Actinoplanes sp. NBRC 101535]